MLTIFGHKTQTVYWTQADLARAIGMNEPYFSLKVNNGDFPAANKKVGTRKRLYYEDSFAKEFVAQILANKKGK